jgi:hypothetical protein
MVLVYEQLAALAALAALDSQSMTETPTRRTLPRERVVSEEMEEMAFTLTIFSSLASEVGAVMAVLELRPPRQSRVLHSRSLAIQLELVELEVPEAMLAIRFAHQVTVVMEVMVQQLQRQQTESVILMQPPPQLEGTEVEEEDLSGMEELAMVEMPQPLLMQSEYQLSRMRRPSEAEASA